jgi:hypothetical protein
MAVGLTIAIALLAEPAAVAAPVDPVPTAVAAAPAPAEAEPVSMAIDQPIYGPTLPKPPKPPKPPAAVAPAKDACAANPRPTNPGEILVCAPRPEGYRLDPDVLEAKRQMRSGGRPTPRNMMEDNNCATIGPMGCRGGGINLIAAALTVAKMADRLSKGEEIGSMFITDPHPTEYQLYLQAKRQREAKEAEAAASAKANAAAVVQPEAAKPTTEPAGPAQ